MRPLVFVAVVAYLALTSQGFADGPKQEAPAEGLLFPLPPEEVPAGKFEEWAREAAKEKRSATTYTRIEYDRKAYWVVEAWFGYGDPCEKIAVYAPTKDGAFRRCVVAGPIRVGKLAFAVDAKTGIMKLTEEARNSTKGEVLLSFNLNVTE